MLEDFINQQWQALSQLFRGRKRLGQSKAEAPAAPEPAAPEPAAPEPAAPEPGPQKPSLAVAVGEQQKVNALDEYRRRFASTAGQASQPPAQLPAPSQGFREPPQRPLEPLRPPEPTGNASRQWRQDPPEPPQRPLEPLGPPEPAGNANWQWRQDPPEPPQPSQAPQPPAAPLSPAGSPADPERLWGQGFREAPQPAAARSKQPARAGNASQQRRQKPRGSRKRDEADWTAGFSQVFSEAWGLVSSQLGRRRNELIAAAAACVIVIGAAYGFRAMKTDPADTQPPRVAQATLPAVQPAVHERPKKAPLPAPSKKLFYDRLPAEGPDTAAETPAAPAAAAAPATAAAAPAAPTTAAAAPAARTAPVAAAAPAEPPAGGRTVSEHERLANAPAPPAPPVPAQALADDRPTIVRAERYRPDGTRTDLQQPAAVPASASANAGEAPATVQSAVESKPAPVAVAAQQPERAPAAPAAPVPAAAQPAPASASGFFAQVKSDPNQKAAETELAAIAEKYKAILGEVPLTTRQADLKDRGIWFRVLAGPVKSHDDADNLCKRLKGAGVQACIVQRLD